MALWTDATLVVLIAYYWIGFGMVNFHSRLRPCDQPGYVSSSLSQKVLFGAIWPYVSYFNQELVWFSICFCCAIAVLGAAAYGLTLFTGSILISVLSLAVVRVIPIGDTVLSVPLNLLSTLLWYVIARPLGCSLPHGIQKGDHNR